MATSLCFLLLSRTVSQYPGSAFALSLMSFSAVQAPQPLLPLLDAFFTDTLSFL